MATDDELISYLQPKGSTKHFPWYKERLKWKYLQPNKQSNTLASSRWRFLPNNMDDFRTGIPLQLDTSAFSKKKQIPVPLIDTQSSLTRLTKRRVPRFNTIPISESTAKALYSKRGPRQQLQQSRLENLKDSLLKHPLALYPHLENSIAPELLDEIVGIIDPTMKEESDYTFPTVHQIHTEADTTQVNTATTEDDQEMSEHTDLNLREKTLIYKWPLTKSAEEEEEDRLELAKQRAVSPTQEARVNHVTHDLVHWMRDLGEERAQEYIDEATIKRLFHSDYEAKPILTAPIHVVELANIPVELRNELKSGNVWKHIPDTKNYRAPVQNHKTRYGAWYLHPKLWKPRRWDEPLVDPIEIKKMKSTEARSKTITLDTDLAATHGAQAFREFVVNRRGVALPKFLQSIQSGSRRSIYSKKQSLAF